jgi:hypothetical protein
LSYREGLGRPEEEFNEGPNGREAPTVTGTTDGGFRGEVNLILPKVIRTLSLSKDRGGGRGGCWSDYAAPGGKRWGRSDRKEN